MAAALARLAAARDDRGAECRAGDGLSDADVRGKIFTIGGEEGDHISVKATPIAQAELLDLDPETFASAAYVGRFGWVTVNLSRVDPGMLEGFLRDAWRSVAPAKLRGLPSD